MDLGGWLRSLGLECYEALFRKHAIDDAVLPSLTTEDLRDLGINIVGHRRKLMNAIAALNAGTGAASVHAPVTFETDGAHSAQRRQLTIMFCDMVDSTALSARLDPEDMSAVIRAFHGIITDVAERFDGYIAKIIGDGVRLYFGYPQAHEDDVERAVRAGLAIVDAARSTPYRQEPAFEVRVGIATGLVVVGQLIGEIRTHEHGVVGETPNLAARLQSFAEPGSVVVALSTKRLLGRMFELNPLQPRLVKGFAAPVYAWSVVRVRENVTRFDASRLGAMTPFVGREHELALLLDRWRKTTENEGQLVLVSGEAGIGKSRITVAMRDRLDREQYGAVRYQCSPHHVNDAFYPVIGQIWRAAQFVVGEPTERRLQKLEASVEQLGLNLEQTVPYLAALMSIPSDDRYPPLEMAPADLKERIIAALIASFAAMARDRPVLAVLEDAHWIDPSTLDLLTRTIDQISTLRAMMVVTFRHDFVAPWVGRANVTSLVLSRFGRRDTAAMIDRLVAGKQLPQAVLEEIAAKADGVPLFVEELTKTVLESGLLREQASAYVLAAPLTPLAIPSTLQDSLMARLDRLGPVKEIAQIGAVIGREFSYRLLAAVAPLTEPELQHALRQLIASELINGRGDPPEAIYRFKHALVQDTAYASLTRHRRKQIHADIAAILAGDLAEPLEIAPAVIAQHYTEAGLPEAAVHYWVLAAELSLSRSAPAEADRYAHAGLALIPLLSKGPDQQAFELALYLAWANAMLPMKGYAAQETVTALTEAKRLIDLGAGTNMQRFAVLYQICTSHITAARYEAALTQARQIVEIAERDDDTTYRLVGYRLLGVSLLFEGRLRGALESLERAEQYRDAVRQKPLSYRFGNDPGRAASSYKIWMLWLLGFPDRAENLARRVLTELPERGFANTVAFGTYLAAVQLSLFADDMVATEQRSAELIAYCTENKVEQFRLISSLVHACAHATRVPTETNVLEIRTAFEAERRSGGRISDSVFISQFVKALLNANAVTDAEIELNKAFAFVEHSGERFWLPELHRLSGQIALKQPKPNATKAEICFERAVEIAREQQSRMLELRATTDLARLRHNRAANGEDVRGLLEPALATIEGGDNTFDVRNARLLVASIC
jgi:class 3 adenylate cyclase/tetratricopeptide (TPR) repeat protein